MNRYIARFSKLRPPHVQDAKSEVHIRSVEAEGLINSHPRHDQQGEKCRERVGAEPLAGTKLLGPAKELSNLLVGIDVRSLASIAIQEQAGRGNLGARVGGPEPNGEASNHTQTASPGGRLRRFRLSGPAE